MAIEDLLKDWNAVKAAFDKADTDQLIGGMGKLTSDQLKGVLRELVESGHDIDFMLGEKILISQWFKHIVDSNDDAMRLFIEAADRDGDKLINLNELLMIMDMGDEDLNHKEILTKLVTASAKDGRNGLITTRELRYMIFNAGITADDTVMTLMNELMRMDDDKKLKIEEVVNLFIEGPKKKEPTEEMKQMFRMFDTNADGFISMKELVEYMKMLGCEDVEMFANIGMEDADKDKDGKLNYEEFCKLCEQTQGTEVTMDLLEYSNPSKAVKTAFDKADTEGTGKLTRDQLKGVMRELIESGHDIDFMLGKQILIEKWFKWIVASNASMSLFIEVADRDGDKLINLNELLMIMNLGDEELNHKEMLTKLVTASAEDGNGLITRSELSHMIITAGLHGETTEFLMQMDDDKKLTIEEVVNIFVEGPKKKEPKEVMKQMFREFDTNADGFISKKELTEHMKKSGCPDVKMFSNIFMEEFDKDKDGKLNYEEFCKLCEELRLG